MSTEPQVEVRPAPDPLADGDVLRVVAAEGFRGFARGVALQWCPDNNGTLFALMPADVQPVQNINEADVLDAVGQGNVLRLPRYFEPDQFGNLHRLLLVSNMAFGLHSTMLPAGRVLFVHDGALMRGAGQPYAGLRADGRVLRILSHFCIPIMDDGSVRPENRELAANWATTEVVPNALLNAIRSSPSAPIVRTMLRNFAKVPPPAEATTAEAIIAWLNNRPMFTAWNPDNWTAIRPASPAATDPEPLPAQVNPAGGDRTVEATVRVTRDVSGRVRWTGTRVYTGTLEIPLSVIQEGASDVNDYIRDHLDDLDDEMEDQQVDWERTDDEDYDNTTIDRHNTDSFEAIMEYARERYPDAFDDEDDDDGDDE